MMKKRLLLLFLAVGAVTVNTNAQSVVDTKQSAEVTMLPIENSSKNPWRVAFSHFDLSLTTGTTGVGFDVATPLTTFLQLRTGFSYMPAVEVPMSFEVMVGTNPSTSAAKFQKLSGFLSSFTGYEVDRFIDVLGKPTFWNWNVMFDVYPFRFNKHWHFTAGFFLGPSRIAKAYNTTEDMPSLLAVGIYNNMYDKLHGLSELEVYGASIFDLSSLGDKYKGISFLEPDDKKLLQQALESAGRMGMQVGRYTHDVYYEEDVYETVLEFDDETGEDYEVEKLVHAKGDVKFAKGDPYMMEPDENSMAKAEMHVNSFKPYVGFGYNGRLLKNNDHYRIGFDCGVMFWGGTPSIKTHDGTDLAKDVDGIIGKVGDYVEFIKGIKAYPVLDLRLSYRF
jgi:hypothetical protein